MDDIEKWRSWSQTYNNLVRKMEMDDYISRQAAITLPVMPKRYRKYQTMNLDDVYEQGWDDLQKIIEKQPSADVAPVRHGRWIPKFGGKFTGGAYWFDCSECGHTVTGGNLSGKHFCENCGSRMDGEKNG